MKIEKALTRAKPLGLEKVCFTFSFSQVFVLEFPQICRLETLGSFSVILLPSKLLLTPKPCEYVFTALPSFSQLSPQFESALFFTGIITRICSAIFTLFLCNSQRLHCQNHRPGNTALHLSFLLRNLASNENRLKPKCLSQLNLFPAASVHLLFSRSPGIHKLHEGSLNALSSLLAPGIVPAHSHFSIDID